MLVVLCDTVRYTGRGVFLCRFCGCRTTIEDLQGLELSFPHALVLVDAPTGTILHDCRHVRILEEARRRQKQ